MKTQTHNLNLQRSQSSHIDADLQRIKWAGWTLVGAVACTWASWVSLTSINNGESIGRTQERQAIQYEQLRDDIADIKSAIVSLVRTTGGEP